MTRILDLTLSPSLEGRLIGYHQDLTVRTRRKHRLPKLADVKHLAIRKKTLLGIYGNKMADWQYKSWIDYGKNHAWKEYFPLMKEIVKKDIVPQMELSYACKIDRHQLFSPRYYKDFVYSLSVTYFSQSLFKGKDSHFGKLEKNVAEFFSLVFRERNKRGPENTVATILDNQFLTIFSRGILTPFSLSYVRANEDAQIVCRKMIHALVEDILDEINKKFFVLMFGEVFVDYDILLDELHVIVFLDQSKWDGFFTRMMEN